MQPELKLVGNKIKNVQLDFSKIPETQRSELSKRCSTCTLGQNIGRARIGLSCAWLLPLTYRTTAVVAKFTSEDHRGENGGQTSMKETDFEEIRQQASCFRPVDDE